MFGKEFGLPVRLAAWYEQEAEPEQEPEQEQFDSSALHMAILMHNQASARPPPDSLATRAYISTIYELVGG